LDKAARCERLARLCSSPASEHVMLETAKHWRSLARLQPPKTRRKTNGASSPPAPDDPVLTKMLSGIGSLCR
jgi:hypothetical protein